MPAFNHYPDHANRDRQNQNGWCQMASGHTKASPCCLTNASLPFCGQGLALCVLYMRARIFFPRSTPIPFCKSKIKIKNKSHSELTEGSVTDHPLDVPSGGGWNFLFFYFGGRGWYEVPFFSLDHDMVPHHRRATAEERRALGYPTNVLLRVGVAYTHTHTRSNRKKSTNNNRLPSTLVALHRSSDWERMSRKCRRRRGGGRKRKRPDGPTPSTVSRPSIGRRGLHPSAGWDGVSPPYCVTAGDRRSVGNSSRSRVRSFRMVRSRVPGP